MADEKHPPYTADELAAMDPATRAVIERYIAGDLNPRRVGQVPKAVGSTKRSGFAPIHTVRRHGQAGKDQSAEGRAQFTAAVDRGKKVRAARARKTQADRRARKQRWADEDARNPALRPKDDR